MRKYFEVINTVTWFDDDYESETLVLTPGQIVEIELDDVPNFYPCLVLDNDMLDIAFDTWEEFYEFFKEVNLKESEAIEFVSKDINIIQGPSLVYDNVDTAANGGTLRNFYLFYYLLQEHLVYLHLDL